MYPSSILLIATTLLSAASATPVAAANAVESVAETQHVGEHYALLHRDLPEDLSAANNTHLSTDEYHELLSKRGCDPIGCYANGFFSVTFNAGANNWIRLFGEGQPQQEHGLICSDVFSGFNSWLPYVFMSRKGYCGSGLTRYCCNTYSSVYFKYASITTKPDGDSRCANTGGSTGRCIFPMRP